MPGPLLHVGALVFCAHLGQATPTATNPRVVVSGQPTVVLGTPYMVAGCPFPPPPSGNGPCVTGQFMSAATRVFSNGLPLLVLSSQGICAPTGTPLLLLISQMRVTAL